ncbi:hypothetical protein B0H10DRAFT_2163679 [Mycena sp. CBHHK59/15]|nr:hypothetical protein B0H10DRAFT_2163679 [Mycena sp. CBHHK59/15]
MERGELRGSYIWGRSVNNTRIERLWYDVTHEFGYKWKHFNPTGPEHIWLLHHLFLHCIDEDAQEWAEAWNRHDLQICGERTRSPHDMFFFSQLNDGPRGLERMAAPLDEEVPDPTTYGIDWEVVDDPTLMHHHLMQNPQEWENNNPFAPSVQDLSEVPCEPPDSPFTPAQIAHLDREIAAAVDLTSRSMNIRKLVWKEAFRICNEFYQ